MLLGNLLSPFSHALSECYSADDYQNFSGCRIFSEHQYHGNGYIDVKLILNGSSNALFLFGPFDPDSSASINDIYNSLVPTQVQSRLATAGYKVFVFDFSDNTFDYLQNKGEAAYSAIKEIEETFNVSSSVTLGYSLGGIVSRYALTRLEDDNYKHTSRTFITYDSPHNGANMPIGFQEAVVFLYDGLNKAYKRNKNTFSTNWITELLVNIPLKHMQKQASIAANENLKQPATQQMLINYHGEGGSHSYRTQLQYELNTLGFPKRSRTVSFVNGSAGEKLEFAGDFFWQYDSSKKLYSDWHFYVGVDDSPNTIMYGQFYFWDPDADDPESRYPYRRTKKPENLFGIQPVDRNIPCSTSDAPQQISSAISNGIDMVFGTDYNRRFQSESCFIPVSSALGVSEFAYSSTPDEIISTFGRETIPFDAFYINESNSTHLAQDGFEDDLEFEIFNRHDLVWLPPVINSILM